MSEKMTNTLFVHLLRDCLIPPAYEQTPAHPRTWHQEVERIERALHAALKVAFDDNESWFIKTPDRRLLVRPRECAEWLLAKPMRAPLVPEGLKIFLSGQGDPEPIRSGAPGRPTSMQLVIAEAERRRALGETDKSVGNEAKILKLWFGTKHSRATQPSAKTIENNIRRAHKEWLAQNP